MSHIAELVLSHPDLPLTPTLRALPQVGIRVESQPITTETEPVIFVSIETDKTEVLETALNEDPTVKRWKFSTEFRGGRVYQIQLSTDVTLLSPRMTAFGLRVLDLTHTDGAWRYRVHTPDKHRLATFHRYCRQEDVEWELGKLYSLKAENSEEGGDSRTIPLTERQREVARTAVKMGYFESNGADAEEVAAELDIAPSTLSSHLRTITAKVFRELFDESAD